MANAIFSKAANANARKAVSEMTADYRAVYGSDGAQFIEHYFDETLIKVDGMEPAEALAYLCKVLAGRLKALDTYRRKQGKTGSGAKKASKPAAKKASKPKTKKASKPKTSKRATPAKK